MTASMFACMCEEESELLLKKVDGEMVRRGTNSSHEKYSNFGCCLLACLHYSVWLIVVVCVCVCVKKREGRKNPLWNTVYSWQARATQRRKNFSLCVFILEEPL